MARPAVAVRAPNVLLGSVALQEADGDRVVLGELGQALPQISDGYGGITVVDRTARVGLTWWQGRPPNAVTFTIRFDRRETEESVESQIHALEALAGVGIGDEPLPTVVFNAAGVVPLDQNDGRASHWLWTVSGFDPGDYERNDAGKRFVAEFNLTLTRWSADDELEDRSEAAVRRLRKKTKHQRGPKHRTHKVKTGETLVSIAAKEYGDVDRWPDIADANKLRDPRKQLRPGLVLRLPR